MDNDFGLEVYGEPLTPGGSTEDNILYSTREATRRVQVIDSFDVTLESSGSKRYDFLTAADVNKLTCIAVPLGTLQDLFPRRALPANNAYITGAQVNWTGVFVEWDGTPIPSSITSAALTQILVLL